MSKCLTYSIKSEEQFGWLRKAKEPDSAICSLCNKTFRINGSVLAQVKSYQKSKSHMEKESTYPNRFGIVPYIKECLLYDVSNVSFSFKFNKTATSKVDKQYDAYMQYWSKKSNLVSNRYCRSLFVGYCTNEDLLEHFNHFVKEMHCEHSFLLHLGMDGIV